MNAAEVTHAKVLSGLTLMLHGVFGFAPAALLAELTDEVLLRVERERNCAARATAANVLPAHTELATEALVGEFTYVGQPASKVRAA